LLWYAAKIFGFCRARNINLFAEHKRLFVSVFREISGQDIVRLAAFRKQVHRDHSKLHSRAALQKQDFIIIRNGHHLAEQGFRIFDDAVIDF
jgi:hypothetical protein